MGAKTDSELMRADKRRRRRQARAERRRADRARVAVVAAQQLGITVAVLADARRAAGVSTAITPTLAQRWASDPRTARPWLMRLLGERMAAAAAAEYRRQQQAEQHERRILAAEGSALAKVRAGKRRFNDDEW